MFRPLCIIGLICYLICAECRAEQLPHSGMGERDSTRTDTRKNFKPTQKWGVLLLGAHNAYYEEANQLFGALDQDFHFGFGAGVSYEWFKSYSNSFRAELSYQKKGAKILYRGGPSPLWHLMEQHSLQLGLSPLIVRVSGLQPSPYFLFGLYGAFHMKNHFYSGSNSAELVRDDNLSDEMARFDGGLHIGLGLYLGERPLEIRLEMGLARQLQLEGQDAYKNRSITVLIAI